MPAYPVSAPARCSEPLSTTEPPVLGFVRVPGLDQPGRRAYRRIKAAEPASFDPYLAEFLSAKRAEIYGSASRLPESMTRWPFPETDSDRAALADACRASLVAAWRKDGTLLPVASATLPIDLVESDAPVGDPWPRHLFMRDVAWPEPLPPVLRADAPPAVMLLCSDGLGWTPFTQARFDDWLAAPIPPRRPGILRRLWADWHEWIVAGAIILFAAGVALSTHN